MKRGFSTHLVLALGVLAASMPAGAAQIYPLSSSLGAMMTQGSDTSSQWFERADGRGRFVLDRRTHPALLWPEDSDEVVPIYRARAAGGGEVWLTDTDRTILRLSHLGGWTYFPSDQPDGVIVEAVGAADSLIAQPVGEGDLQDAARDLADLLTEFSRQEVSIELTNLSPYENSYLIDTMEMVATGAQAAQRRAVRDIQIVRIGIGDTPLASFHEGVLDISIAPEKGYAGRPSSDFIRRTLDQAAR